MKHYPFLVVAERARKRGKVPGVWMPYWHTVKEKKRMRKKYGQWAPYMDMNLFDSLMKQARRARLVK